MRPTDPGGAAYVQVETEGDTVTVSVQRFNTLPLALTYCRDGYRERGRQEPASQHGARSKIIEQIGHPGADVWEYRGPWIAPADSFTVKLGAS